MSVATASLTDEFETISGKRLVPKENKVKTAKAVKYCIYVLGTRCHDTVTNNLLYLTYVVRDWIKGQITGVISDKPSPPVQTSSNQPAGASRQ